MPFYSISKIANENLASRGPGRKSEAPLRTRVRVEKTGARTIGYSLSSDLLDDADIRRGDSVDILFDPEDQTGLIARVKDGRYTMSRPKSSARGYLKMVASPGTPVPPDGSHDLEVISITREGVLFRWPEGTTMPTPVLKAV